jgi:hypothetical protein
MGQPYRNNRFDPRQSFTTGPLASPITLVDCGLQFRVFEGPLEYVYQCGVETLRRFARVQMNSRLYQKRQSSRLPARRAATVSFGAETLPVTCVIWDISEGGARLAIAHPLANLPHRFTLNLFKDGSVRRDCEVVWTDARFVGVRFTSLVS